jgi:hypothetical protein
MYEPYCGVAALGYRRPRAPYPLNLQRFLHNTLVIAAQKCKGATNRATAASQSAKYKRFTASKPLIY